MFDIVFNLALLLTIIGGLNWGLVGLNNVDLIKYINKLYFKNETFVRFMYIIVGVAALYVAIFSLSNKMLNNYIDLKKFKFNYQNQEHHWCIDGKEGDIHCKNAKYGNKCINNTCVFI